jgi:hypothetical protein
MAIRSRVLGAAFLLACSDAVAQAQPKPGGSEARGGSAPVPVPVEVALVDRYASMNLILAKPLAAASRWGVFHQSTLVVGHSGSATPDDLATQTLLTFAPAGGFRLTAGAFYATTPGVVATAGGQYLHAGPNWFVLLSPRVSLEGDPAYSAFSIVRYQRGPRTGTRLYLELQALNTFRAEEHIRSFQWLRLGADRRGTQFGLALNFDAEGRNPRTETSVGVFLRRPLF